jgi:hypothetical protein
MAEPTAADKLRAAAAKLPKPDETAAAQGVPLPQLKPAAAKTPEPDSQRYPFPPGSAMSATAAGPVSDLPVEQPPPPPPLTPLPPPPQPPGNLVTTAKANLGKVGVNLVDLPGPGIMRAQVAFTDVTTATPVLRSVSLIVPQARLINMAQSLVTGSYGETHDSKQAVTQAKKASSPNDQRCR